MDFNYLVEFLVNVLILGVIFYILYRIILLIPSLPVALKQLALLILGLVFFLQVLGLLGVGVPHYAIFHYRG